MKKKIFVIAIAVCVLAVAAYGATLAFFTDTDQEENVFTVGNIAIDLTENFTQESLLMPGTSIMNDVTKEALVTNTGSNDAYVRVHIAIPAILDGDFEGLTNNVLHFDTKNHEASIDADLANHGSECECEGYNLPGYTGGWHWLENGAADGEMVSYTATVDGILYNVYVVTYQTALAPEEITDMPVISQVYLDQALTMEMVAEINTVLDGNWNMLVFAEGVQVAGFESAYAAFAAAFGAAGSYNPWANN